MTGLDGVPSDLRELAAELDQDNRVTATTDEELAEYSTKLLRYNDSLDFTVHDTEDGTAELRVYDPAGVLLE